MLIFPAAGPFSRDCLNSTESTVDEQALLRIAKELVVQLDISTFRPGSVSWAEDIEWTSVDSPPDIHIEELSWSYLRDVPVGWCVFRWDRVILPTEMKGKLDPEEWRPLVASSLIYEAKLRKGRYFGTIIASIPIIIDALGWLALLAVSNPVSGVPVSLLILDTVGLFVALYLAK